MHAAVELAILTGGEIEDECVLPLAGSVFLELKSDRQAQAGIDIDRLSASGVEVGQDRDVLLGIDHERPHDRDAAPFDDPDKAVKSHDLASFQYQRRALPDQAKSWRHDRQILIFRCLRDGVDPEVLQLPSNPEFEVDGSTYLGPAEDIWKSCVTHGTCIVCDRVSEQTVGDG